MKLKTLVVSVLVLAVLAGIAFLLQRPSPPPSADPRVGEPLVQSGTIESTARLVLADQGKRVEVVRQPDNSWRVATYHDMPADFSKLSRFVAELGEAKIQRFVTGNPDRIARLDFKDTRIELHDSAGKPLQTIVLGKHAETGGGRYVRLGDEQKAYLANLNAWLDPESKNWADAQLLSVKPEEVAKVEITFPEGGPVVVSRATKDDAWSAAQPPENQRVRAERVSSLLSSFANLRFSETTAPDDPAVANAKAHERTVTLTTFDNKTVTLALGRKPEEKKLKPPAATNDGKSGPAALGSVADLGKAESAKEGKDAEEKSDEAKPLAPEYETIPAGPVFVSIKHSDASAPVNVLMQKRAFQVYDYVFTGLPQKRDELFEPVPAAAPVPAEGSPAAPAAQPPPDTTGPSAPAPAAEPTSE